MRRPCLSIRYTGGQRIGRASQKLQDLRDKGMPTYHRDTAEAVERIAFLPQRMRVVQRRWEHLYDREEHIRLRSAIANELDKIR